MGAFGRRVGSLVAVAALALTPVLRLGCLALCGAWTQSPASVVASTVAPPITAASDPHAHHHRPAAAAASTPADAASATGARADARCDTDRRGRCPDPAGIVPLPAARAAADAILAPPAPRLATVDLAALATYPPVARPLAPPGPPPAATPLRI